MKNSQLQEHFKIRTTAHSCTSVPGFSAARAVGRFRRFMTKLDDVAPTLPPAQVYMLCVLAHEFVFSIDDLSAFLESTKKPVFSREQMYIEWESHDRTHRRALSARTMIALSRLPKTVDWELEVKSLPRLLVCVYPDADTFRSIELLSVMFADAKACAYLALDNEMFNYACGNAHITLLSRTRLLACDVPCGSHEVDPSIQAQITNSTLARAIDVAFEGADKDGRSGTGARCLKELAALFSTAGRTDVPRVSDWRERKTVCERIELTATHIVRHGSAVDHLLLGWICYMLSEGSIRLKNPSISTVNRYFQDVAQAVSAHFHRNQTVPSHADEDAWESLFTTLSTTESMQPAAVMSFYMYCQARFGMALKIHSASARTSEPLARAGMIWDDEYHRLQQLAVSACMDQRVNDSIEAILTLGHAFAIRVGEVQALRIDDIQLTPRELVVHFHPRRGQHTGKSYCAIRAMQAHDPVARRVIEKWLDRRKKEGAIGSDLLFGDPHEPTQLYRFGFSMRWINHQLKIITGDPEASYHDFRHTSVDRMIMDALRARLRQEGWRCSLPIRSQVGHASNSRTVLTSYFHRPDLAVRLMANAVNVTQKMNHRNASFWLGKTADAVRKAKQRSKDSRYYAHELQSKAEKWVVEQRKAPRITEQLIPRASYEYPSIRRFMTDLMAGLSSESIALRCSLTQSMLSALAVASLKAYSFATNTCFDNDDELVVQLKAEPEKLLGQVRALITNLRFDFDYGNAQSLDRLINFFEDQRCVNDQVTTLARAWSSCRRGAYISLCRQDAVTPLLEWLKHIEFNPACLQLRYVVDESSAVVDPDSYEQRHSEQLQIIEAAQNILKTSCPPLAVEPKSGRPDVYLVISGSPPEKKPQPASAAIRMGRFHALMFSVLVWTFAVSGGVDR
jgi:hypothetical protein